MRWDLTGRPQSRRPSDLVFLLEEFESIWCDIRHGYQFSKILWEFQQKSGTKSFNMSSIVSRLSSNHWLSFSCHRNYILERLWLKHTFSITSKIQQTRSQVTPLFLQNSLNKITDSGTPRVCLMIFGDFEWFWSSERLELGSACSGRFRRDLGAMPSVYRVNEWNVMLLLLLLLGIYHLFVQKCTFHQFFVVLLDHNLPPGGKVVDLSMLRPRGQSPRSPKRSPRSPRSPRQLRLLDPETAKLAEAWSGATVVKDERHWKDGSLAVVCWAGFFFVWW